MEAVSLDVMRPERVRAIHKALLSPHPAAALLDLFGLEHGEIVVARAMEEQPDGRTRWDTASWLYDEYGEWLR